MSSLGRAALRVNSGRGQANRWFAETRVIENRTVLRHSQPRLNHASLVRTLAVLGEGLGVHEAPLPREGATGPNPATLPSLTALFLPESLCTANLPMPSAGRPPQAGR